MRMLKSITAKRVREMIIYDPNTGRFTWKISRHGPRSKIGDEAGSVHRSTSGYRTLCLDGVVYHANRIAWLYMTGEWPSGVVDHKDLDRANNRWSNLRDADWSQSRINTPVGKNNTSGLKGVSKRKDRDKWYASISFQGKQFCLGYFETAQEAHAAYMTRAQELYGEFARAA